MVHKGNKSVDADAASTMCQNVTNNIYSIYGGNIFQYNAHVLNANHSKNSLHPCLVLLFYPLYALISNTDAIVFLTLRLFYQSYFLTLKMEHLLFKVLCFMFFFFVFFFLNLDFAKNKPSYAIYKGWQNKK